MREPEVRLRRCETSDAEEAIFYVGPEIIFLGKAEELAAGWLRYATRAAS